MKIIAWILRIVIAFVLISTLFFKFSGAKESIELFTKLGVEPWGRIGTGIIELIASLLILIPRTTGIGALLAMGTMGGAIVAHLTVIGIESQNDGGQLFYMAIIIFIASAILAIMYRQQWLRIIGVGKGGEL